MGIKEVHASLRLTITVPTVATDTTGDVLESEANFLAGANDGRDVLLRAAARIREQQVQRRITWNAIVVGHDVPVNAVGIGRIASEA